MNGRLKESNVDRRRRRLLVMLLASAAANDEVVQRLAEKLSVGEKAVRNDFDVLREEFEAARKEVLPQDLPAAIRAGNTPSLLKALGQRIMLGLVDRSIDAELASGLVDLLREQRHILRAVHQEQGLAAIKALDVLTPQEQEVLRKYRDNITPAALKPGEFPPPPEGSPPRKAPDRPAGGAP
jgi:predicted ArsR family transcriptional regulator